MTAATVGAMRWCASLAAKFGRVVFWRTLLIVLVTLVSQLSTLLASVLPLKVVILLGSDSIPRYIPEALAAQGRETLIVGLSAATVGFFVLHLITERLIGVITVQASGKLLASSHKMVLFENQDEIAGNAYQRFSRALAGAVFVALGILVIALLYPDLALAVVAYLLAAVLVLFVWGESREHFRERLYRRLPKILAIMGGIGFFSAFVYLVVDFVLQKSPGVLTAIISLLLSRQVFNRLATTVKDIAALSKQQMRINALFFHGKLLLSRTRNEKTIWPLLETDTRREWINAVLEELVVGHSVVKQIEWIACGARNNVATLLLSGEAGEDYYLIKLFGANRKAYALHEATLLSEAPRGLPAPVFLGSTHVQQFICSVYSIRDGKVLQPGKKTRPLVRRVRARMLSLPPPEDVAHRYLRSRPVLWQRMTRDFLKRIQVAVVSVEDDRRFRRFLKALPTLRLHLKSLPLTIVNPGLTSITLWEESETRELVLLDWGRWSLEPVGVKWPVRVGAQGAADETASITQELQEAARWRSDLDRVSVEQVELAALASALEDRCLKQRFDEGLGLIDQILDRLSVLSDTHPAARGLSA